MISTPSSPAFTPSRSITGKPHTENDNPQLSPKRSFAQLDEDHLSQPELKRRDARRAPLDPLSSSDLENRRRRDSQSTVFTSYHTLVTPSSVPDLPVLVHPEQPVSSGSCGMQRSDMSAALVCSWPPPAPTPGTPRSSHRNLVGQLSSQVHRLDEKLLSRATCLESTYTAWSPPHSFRTQPTTTMARPTRTAGWRSDNVLQPIRSRTHATPSVRRPPGELWQSDPRPTEADDEPVDAADFLAYSTPPGLPPPRTEIRRSGSSSDLIPRGSMSLSLAHGSQPLRASEHTKAVPPIGAERSRVVSITSSRSHFGNFPATPSRDPSNSPWHSSPRSPTSQAKRQNGINLSNATSPEKAQAASSDAMSREDLERLLRHAVRNKHAPKIISPLSPLRAAVAALVLSTDPAYQARIPSQLNAPSPRYAHYPLRRARTVCEGYQSLDWNATCAHCQECKRDAIGKRLLAFRYRQQQTCHFQRNRLLAYPSRVSTNDDRIARARRIREAFAYEMDEEERSLWEEVAAVTGAGPVSFSRGGASCASAVYGNDDGFHGDHLEAPDEGLLANESATLFREVSAY